MVGVALGVSVTLVRVGMQSSRLQCSGSKFYILNKSLALAKISLASKISKYIFFLLTLFSPIHLCPVRSPGKPLCSLDLTCQRMYSLACSLIVCELGRINLI